MNKTKINYILLSPFHRYSMNSLKSLATFNSPKSLSQGALPKYKKYKAEDKENALPPNHIEKAIKPSTATPKPAKPLVSTVPSEAANLGKISSRIHQAARPFHGKALSKPDTDNLNPVFFIKSNYCIFSTQIEQFIRIMGGEQKDHACLLEVLKEIGESNILLVPLLDCKEEILRVIEQTLTTPDRLTRFQKIFYPSFQQMVASLPLWASVEETQTLMERLIPLLHQIGYSHSELEQIKNRLAYIEDRCLNKNPFLMLFSHLLYQLKNKGADLKHPYYVELIKYLTKNFDPQSECPLVYKTGIETYRERLAGYLASLLGLADCLVPKMAHDLGTPYITSQKGKITPTTGLFSLFVQGTNAVEELTENLLDKQASEEIDEARGLFEKMISLASYQKLLLFELITFHMDGNLAQYVVGADKNIRCLDSARIAPFGPAVRFSPEMVLPLFRSALLDFPHFTKPVTEEMKQLILAFDPRPLKKISLAEDLSEQEAEDVALFKQEFKGLASTEELGPLKELWEVYVGEDLGDIQSAEQIRLHLEKRMETRLSETFLFLQPKAMDGIVARMKKAQDHIFNNKMATMETLFQALNPDIYPFFKLMEKLLPYQAGVNMGLNGTDTLFTCEELLRQAKEHLDGLCSQKEYEELLAAYAKLKKDAFSYVHLRTIMDV